MNGEHDLLLVERSEEGWRDEGKMELKQEKRIALSYREKTPIAWKQSERWQASCGGAQSYFIQE